MAIDSCIDIKVIKTSLSHRKMPPTTNATLNTLSNILAADLALLERYLALQKAAGFTTAARIIEIMARELLTCAGKGNFKDANLVKNNHLAIDLFDNISTPKVAAQVTANANLAKIKKTVAAFTKVVDGKSLQSTYDHLYIWGLSSATKKFTTWKKPAFVTVLDSEDLINVITSRADVKAISTAIDAIRKHQDRSILLSPHADSDCLEIVMGVMNRSALKHAISCEGNLPKMLEGLKEVSEVASIGELNGRSVAKVSSEYLDTRARQFLTNVQESIHRITAICNKKYDGYTCNLNMDEQNKVNELKKKIISEANAISKIFNLKQTLEFLDGTY